MTNLFVDDVMIMPQETHYNDVIMGAMVYQITSLMIVYSIVYSDADQRKHQSSPPLAFVRGIHRGPVNSPHKWPVTRKMFPFRDVIMSISGMQLTLQSCLRNISKRYKENRLKINSDKSKVALFGSKVQLKSLNVDEFISSYDGTPLK